MILDVLYRCKDVEKSGNGFQRMNKMCSEVGVKWSYEKTDMVLHLFFTE